MSESKLPEGWIWTRLGDLVDNPKQDLVDGPFGSNLKSEEYIEEGIPVFKIQNIKVNRFVEKHMSFISEAKAKTLIRHSFQTGDLIITKLGEPLGLCCKVPKKYAFGIIVADLMRLRPSRTKVYDEYLINIINSDVVKKQFKAITKGTTRARVNLTIVRDINIPLPPRATQEKIVSKIEELFSEVDKGIEEIKTTQKQLKVYRQAVLKSAFEGKLTKEWRDLFEPCEGEALYKKIVSRRETEYQKKLGDHRKGELPKPKRPFNLDPKNELQEDLFNMGDITSAWKIVPLVFISDNTPDAIVDGPFGSSINVNEDYIESGVPVIRMVNIRPYRFVGDNMKFIREAKFKELRRHNILPGDVLIAKVGATIGDCCMYPFSQPEAMLSTTGSCRIRVDDAIMNNKFLQYYMSFHKKTLQAIASQTAQPFLNMKVLKSFPIVLPTKEEQQQIVQEIESRLSVCDKIEETITNNLKQAEALRQSILKKAFEGELV